MAGHGGYRAPAQPAAVSGPGQLSQRTDGGPAQALSAPTGLPYGMHQQEINEQRTNPLPAQQQAPTTAPSTIARQAVQGGQQPQTAGPQTIAWNAPSQRPNEPVTTPGPGMTPTNPVGPMTQMLSSLAPTDATGVVAQLLTQAQSLGV